MSSNYYETNMRKFFESKKETIHITVDDDSSPYFSQLMKAYPTSGSKINWQNVADSIEQTEEIEELKIERYIAFFDAMVNHHHLTGNVIYLGDSATDFALSGPIECMREALAELLSIPQHHYLICPDYSWCMCFSMEGNIAFGFSPVQSNLSV